MHRKQQTECGGACRDLPRNPGHLDPNRRAIEIRCEEHQEREEKKNYDGSALQSASIGEDKFLCIKGDFFKVIEDGSIKFLQKSSDASSKPVYNGNQAVFINGTAGNPGDYFLYISSSRELKHLSRKTVSTVVAESFGKCEQALAKAKAINDDISKLNEAVQEFNHCGSVKN